MGSMTWHGGGMWIFWLAVIAVVALSAWWGSRRMGRRK